MEDSGKGTASTTFELIVDPVDDPPVIRLPSSATMDEDTTAFFEIVVEDVDGPGRDPAGGHVSLRHRAAPPW